MRIQWSDMLRITRGCKATETLPVTPEAITLGLAAVMQRHKQEALKYCRDYNSTETSSDALLLISLSVLDNCKIE